MRESLILIGASVRAAAFSALRAGLRPWCADLFGDADLRARCPVAVLSPDRYPRGFLDVVAQVPPGPWMYTGALENHRWLIRRLASLRPLWGNSSASLAAVRSPHRLQELCEDAGLSCPAVRTANSLPRSGRWLVKPRAGAAGRGIRFLDGRLPQRFRRCYLQEFIEGESGGAVFASERLLGISRQLIGVDWLHAGGFAYCGSIGPWVLSDSARSTLEKIGAALGLRGLFGVDFVLRGDVPWPVEVNPRYTASVEVLEYASGIPALALHCAAFDSTAPEPLVRARMGIVGKAIYYAPNTLRIPQEGPWMETLRTPPSIEELPAFADIPEAGQVIEAGRPVLTFFARGDDLANCEERLRRAAAGLDSIFAAG